MLKFHFIKLFVEDIVLITHVRQGGNGLGIILDNCFSSSHWQFCTYYRNYQ